MEPTSTPVSSSLQAQSAALGFVLELELGDGEIDVFVVVAVGNVLEEMLDDRRGDHVAGVLRDVAAVALEGDADDLAACRTGPPELPGLIAASIWQARWLSTAECVYDWKSMRETTPRVTLRRSPPIGYP